MDLNSLNDFINHYNQDSCDVKKRSSFSDVQDDNLSKASNDCSSRDFEDCDFDDLIGFSCKPITLQQASNLNSFNTIKPF